MQGKVRKMKNLMQGNPKHNFENRSHYSGLVNQTSISLALSFNKQIWKMSNINDTKSYV